MKQVVFVSRNSYVFQPVYLLIVCICFKSPGGLLKSIWTTFFSCRNKSRPFFFAGHYLQMQIHRPLNLSQTNTEVCGFSLFVRDQRSFVCCSWILLSFTSDLCSTSSCYVCVVFFMNFASLSIFHFYSSTHRRKETFFFAKLFPGNNSNGEMHKRTGCKKFNMLFRVCFLHAKKEASCYGNIFTRAKQIQGLLAGKR